MKIRRFRPAVLVEHLNTSVASGASLLTLFKKQLFCSKLRRWRVVITSLDKAAFLLQRKATNKKEGEQASAEDTYSVRRAVRWGVSGGTGKIMKLKRCKE